MKIKLIKKGSKKLTCTKARIIARCMGDGSVFKCRSNYCIRYEVKDKELLKSFEKDIFDIYGLKMILDKNPSGKTGELIPFVLVRSKLIYEDLHRYSKSYFSKEWRVPKQIKNTSLKIKKEFLKAFFDDEGSVIPIEYSYRAVVRLYSINKIGLLDIQRLLNEFNINSRLISGFGFRRNIYALVITKDIKRFRDFIGFNSTKKQNKLIQNIRKSL